MCSFAGTVRMLWDLMQAEGDEDDLYIKSFDSSRQPRYLHNATHWH